GLLNEEPKDELLIKELLEMMRTSRADYTNTFRALTNGKPEETALFGAEAFASWHERWQARLGRQQEPKEAVLQLMRRSNPAVIPRNHRVEEALEAAVEQGDDRPMRRLLDALAAPYAHTPEQAEYCTLPEPTDRPYRTYCGT
ncbi:protein adenylyltransferase SelO family protein, partial [Cutibacterium acnes]